MVFLLPKYDWTRRQLTQNCQWRFLRERCIAGLTAKVVELLRVAEGKVTEVLTHECKEVIRQSPPQIWTPEVPVHSVIEPSEFVMGIMEFVKVGACPVKTDKSAFARLQALLCTSFCHRVPPLRVQLDSKPLVAIILRKFPFYCPENLIILRTAACKPV